MLEIRETMIKEVKKDLMITMHQIEDINKKIGIIKTNQMEVLYLKSLTETKHSLEGLNTSYKLAEIRISKLEDGRLIDMQAKEQRGKKMKKTKHLREMSDTIKGTSLRVMIVPERRAERGRTDIQRNNG